MAIFPKDLYPQISYGSGAGIPLWTPAQLVTRRWFDPRVGGSTITAGDGNGVAIYEDLSDLGIDAVQSTGGDQPQTGTRDINGHNVLDFDGVNHFLELTINVTMLDATVFAVIETDNLLGFQNILGLSGNNFQMRLDQTTGATTIASGTPYWGNPSTSTEVVTAEVPAIVAFVFDASASISHLIDGVRDEPATSNDGAGFTGYDVIGNREGVNHFDGKIGEIIIFDTVLSAADILKVEGYLAWGWDLKGNLPADHDYLNSPPFA